MVMTRWWRMLETRSAGPMHHPRIMMDIVTSLSLLPGRFILAYLVRHLNVEKLGLYFRVLIHDLLSRRRFGKLDLRFVAGLHVVVQRTFSLAISEVGIRA
jgi:hypothetical protein